MAKFRKECSATLRELIKAKEVDVRKAMKRISRKKGFSRAGITAQANTRRRDLKSSASIHGSCDTLDGPRLSAACPMERLRFEMWAHVHIYPLLFGQGEDVFTITVADRRWRVPATNRQVPEDVISAVSRKFKAGMQRLKGEGYDVIGFCVFELSVGLDLDGTDWWEPHFHALVTGAPREAMKAAFACRQQKSDRGRRKPTRVKLVNRTRRKALSYLTKIKPTERVEYKAKNGRMNRYSNPMTDVRLKQWVRFMEKNTVSDLAVFYGFSRQVDASLRTCEMTQLVKSFVEISKRGGSR